MIDLHVHSKFSDGSKEIEEILQLADELGIEQIAITDHNILEGSIIARALAPQKVVVGIELSVGYTNNEELHLLGYFPRLSNYYHLRFILKEGEIQKNLATAETIERLNQKGYDITLAEAAKYTSGIVNRVHICRALMEHGYISSVSEGFEKLVGDHCEAYVPRKLVTLQDAADAIKRDGGIAVLAHPYNYSDVKDIPKLLNDVVGVVDGIECYHPSATAENSKYLMLFATTHNMMITGGSDYHGDNKPNIKLGMMNVDEQYKIDIY